MADVLARDRDLVRSTEDYPNIKSFKGGRMIFTDNSLHNSPNLEKLIWWQSAHERNNCSHPLFENYIYNLPRLDVTYDVWGVFCLCFKHQVI